MSIRGGLECWLDISFSLTHTLTNLGMTKIKLGMPASTNFGGKPFVITVNAPLKGMDRNHPFLILLIKMKICLCFVMILGFCRIKLYCFQQLWQKRKFTSKKKIKRRAQLSVW